MLIDKLEIGQRVWTMSGPGRVVSKSGLQPYPIQVLLDSILIIGEVADKLCFTEDGKSWSRHLYPSLWLNEPTPWPNPQPVPQKDDRIEVSNDNVNWYPRYATGDFDATGRVKAFASGADSWSSRGQISYWYNWRFAPTSGDNNANQ